MNVWLFIRRMIAAQGDGGPTFEPGDRLRLESGTDLLLTEASDKVLLENG